MISDTGLTSYNELNRLAGTIDEWRNYGKMQYQLQG